MKKAGRAHHSLDEAKELASKSMTSSRTKALDPLVEHCGSPRRAYEFAAATITSLEEQAYSQTVMMRLNQEFDIYGAERDGVVWFIKFAVDIDARGEPFLFVVSFHPSANLIRTIGGELKP